MKIRLALVSSLLATFLYVDCWSQSYTVFPGNGVDQRTRRTQERVEEIYTTGEFERAILLYEKELAPLGDKYAQYMVGYMYQNGEGVSPDNVEALAWYRIAAERGEQLLVRVRDNLRAEMSAQELSESDGRFRELWKAIGDRSLILNLIRQDLAVLKDQTGTRISGSVVSSPGLVFKPSGQPISPNFYRDVRVRLDARIEYLEGRVEIVDEAVADEIEGLRLQGARAKAELAALGNR